MYHVIAIEDGQEKPVSEWDSYELADNECDELEREGFEVLIVFKE